MKVITSSNNFKIVPIQVGQETYYMEIYSRIISKSMIYSEETVLNSIEKNIGNYYNIKNDLLKNPQLKSLKNISILNLFNLIIDELEMEQKNIIFEVKKENIKLNEYSYTTQMKIIQSDNEVYKVEYTNSSTEKSKLACLLHAFLKYEPFYKILKYIFKENTSNFYYYSQIELEKKYFYYKIDIINMRQNYSFYLNVRDKLNDNSHEGLFSSKQIMRKIYAKYFDTNKEILFTREVLSQDRYGYEYKISYTIPFYSKQTFEVIFFDTQMGEEIACLMALMKGIDKDYTNDVDEFITKFKDNNFLNKQFMSEYKRTKYREDLKRTSHSKSLKRKAKEEYYRIKEIRRMTDEDINVWNLKYDEIINNSNENCDCKNEELNNQPNENIKEDENISVLSTNSENIRFENSTFDKEINDLETKENQYNDYAYKEEDYSGYFKKSKNYINSSSNNYNYNKNYRRRYQSFKSNYSHEYPKYALKRKRTMYTD